MVVKTCLFWLKMMKCGIDAIKFHIAPVYGYKYLKAKVTESDGVIEKTFWLIICQSIILALFA